MSRDQIETELAEARVAYRKAADDLHATARSMTEAEDLSTARDRLEQSSKRIQHLEYRLKTFNEGER